MSASELTIDGKPLSRVIELDLATLKSLAAEDPQRPSILLHLSNVLFMKYENSSNKSPEFLDAAIKAGEQALAAVSPSDTGRGRMAHSLGHRYWLKFQSGSNKDDIDKAIESSMLAVSCTPVIDLGPRLLMILSLGSHYCSRENKFGDVKDACRAIHQYRMVTDNLYERFGEINRLWNNIANQCEAILGGVSGIQDLEGIIHNTEAILQAAEKHKQSSGPAIHTIRAAVASLLHARYSREKSLEDLERSIAVRTLVAGMNGHRYHAALESDLVTSYGDLSNHALVLRNEYMHNGTITALEEALELTNRAEIFFSSRAVCHNIAAVSEMAGRILNTMFDLTGNIELLDKAIEKTAYAVKNTKRDRDKYLENLATYFAKRQPNDFAETLSSLSDKFNFLIITQPPNGLPLEQKAYDECQLLLALYNEKNRINALDEVLSRYQRLNASAGPLQKHGFESQTMAAISRFKLRSHESDLTLALQSAEAALNLEQEGDSSKANHLDTISNLYGERYHLLHEVMDLENSITCSVKAISLASQSDRGRMLVNLSNKYKWRFEHFHAGEDLAQALHCCEQSFEVKSSKEQLLPLKINNYGELLITAFYHTHDVKYLDRSIEQGERLESIWDRTRPSIANLHWLSNYGIRLDRRGLLRYHANMNAEAKSDIQHAITLTTKSLELATQFKLISRQASMQFNLGRRYASMAQVDMEKETEWLAKAIPALKEAIKLTPSGGPAYSRYARNLASYIERSSNLSVDEQELAGLYESAFLTAKATAAERFLALPPLMHCLTKMKSYEKLEFILKTAIELIPALHIRSLRRQNQQQRVRLVSNIACLIAAVSLQLGRSPYTALSRLEQARMVIFGSVIDQRQDDARLASEHPKIHEALHLQQRILEDNEDVADAETFDVDRSSAGASARLAASLEITEIVAGIRRLDGFQNFQLSLTEEQMRTVATDGPIVIINVTSFRADAIIVYETGIEAIELPNLTMEAARTQYLSLQTALSRAAKDPTSGTKHANNAIIKNLQWLWHSFAGQIAETFNTSVYSVKNSPQRIWWVPCDILASFPIHAAGNYTTYPRVNMLDFFVSSYTTTIKALSFARKRQNQPQTSGQAQTKLFSNQSVLGISMPLTVGREPGQYSSLKSKEEMQCIKERTTGTLDFLILDTPSRKDVIDRIPENDVVHFACHGSSHPVDLFKSRLLLKDHSTMPLTVQTIAALKLSRCQLAYLSACHSAAATTSQDLLGEGINIASAFQLAGFPSVIGTLWQALDDGAVETADLFYDRLVRDAVPGNLLTGSHCAVALHGTIREKMKRARLNALDWAGWVHIGV